MSTRNDMSSHSSWFAVGFSFVLWALSTESGIPFLSFFVALLEEFGWSGRWRRGLFRLHHRQRYDCPYVGKPRLFCRSPKGDHLRINPFGARELALCSTTQTAWHFYIFFSVVTSLRVGMSGGSPMSSCAAVVRGEEGDAHGIISYRNRNRILACVP